jgi:hypothetical protein
MSESGREQEQEGQAEHAVAVEHYSMRRWMFPEEENNGKAKHGNS